MVFQEVGAASQASINFENCQQQSVVDEPQQDLAGWGGNEDAYGLEMRRKMPSWTHLEIAAAPPMPLSFVCRLVQLPDGSC